MKIGKKFFALVLSVILLLSLTACGSTRPTTVATVSTTAPTTAATEAAQPSEENTEATETTETEAAANKTLVVYYSASGNTRRVAEANCPGRKHRPV